MAVQKFFTQDDIELAKMKLSELPDLKQARLTKSDALAGLKEQIISLYDDKGYTVEDIRAALDAAGVPAGVKAIRDMVIRKKTAKNRPSAGHKGAAARTDKKGGTPAASRDPSAEL